ncbi:MAG TPA: MEDS domain-containing protein [Nitrososphaeraceae archaeon]|nr:MEDS domain-containing protein [Nitrososphaeraceae archaeon]HJY15671.1 MEDS domain-containing protein [Nitrososphaeraceae archaeon]
MRADSTENNKVNYRPMKFVDQMEKNKHMVLLYDSKEYAYWVISRYFLNGLQNRESCILFTSDEPQIIKEQLAKEGINVELYKKKHSLRIYHIEKSDNSKHDLLATLKQIREEATEGMKPPYRFVGRTITDTETSGGMELGLALEKTGHEHFHEFNCSQMCYYDISKIEPTMRQKWISGLLENHHYVIYASKPDKAVAFETALLEDEEAI